MAEQQHLLQDLTFPSRYEALVGVLGAEARLVVAPAGPTMDTLEELAHAVRLRGEGVFVPVYAPSGTGKTTLVQNLTSFLPAEYAPTASHDSEVTFEALRETVRAVVGELAANDTRAVPINALVAG